MKKLMIAATIVCAAAFSQASTFTWSCIKVYKEGTQTAINGAAYLFAGDYTTAAIITAIEGKGSEAVSTWLDGISGKISTAAVDGKVTDSTTKPDVTTVGLAADGKSQTLYALIFDTATITDSSKFFVTSTDKVVPVSGNASFGFGAQGNTTLTGASQVSGAWHAVGNVPEPTSGLLLLLGVAGMALRRRRA